MHVPLRDNLVGRRYALLAFVAGRGARRTARGPNGFDIGTAPMLERRIRAVLACIRDARAAELLRDLLKEREIERARLAELRREVHELRLMLRRLCQATEVPQYRID
jgi:hypothetical protein